MNRHDSDIRHACKVAVERPNLSIVVSSNRGDQEIGETETLARDPGNFKPTIDAGPRLLRWKENRKRGKNATQTRAVAV